MKRQRFPIFSPLLCLLLLCLSSCLVGPHYQRPTPYVGNEWHYPTTSLSCPTVVEEPRADWWHLFGDPLLTRYIREAALYNKDLITAEANIREARALCHFAASHWYPWLSADVNASRTQFSNNGPIVDFSVVEGSQAQTMFPNVQFPFIQNLYNIFFDVSWEMDLFGKTCRNVESAQARIQSAIETRNDLLITLFAEVAKTYLHIRGAQQQAALIQQNIALVEKNILLVQERTEYGLDNDLQQTEIEAEGARARAALPSTQAEISQGIYSLSVLTGAPPETLLEEMLIPQPLPCIPQDVALGLRSDLLQRRPDVRRAEEELHSAVAQIGVATAELFPSVSLLGNLGLQSIRFGNLFQADSKTWSIGADLLTPIFQGGRLQANLYAHRAQAQAAYSQYQQTVLTALQEAESALAAYIEDEETDRYFAQNVQKIRKNRELTNDRYANGLVGLTQLIDAERQLISSEQSLLESQIATLIDVVALYKALGGGWEIVQN